MEQALHDLLNAANNALVRNGIKLRDFERNGQVVVQALVPIQGQPPLLLEARVALPADIVGGKLGHKIKVKAKAIAKKIAKSKILKGIAKAAMTFAVPGGAEVMMGAKAVKLAKKLKAMHKHGTPKQKLVAKLVAKKAAMNLQQARSAPAIAPGYPDATASAEPGPGSATDTPGNGYADADDAEMEESMDPDTGAPAGELDDDTSDVEIGPSEDSADDDESE